MRILYFDCSMGAAGDMLAASLLELLTEDEQEKMLEKLNDFGLKNVSVNRKTITKCGIKGTYFDVRVNGESEGKYECGHEHGHEHHGHVHMSDIRNIIESLNLSGKVKEDVLAVYGLIAEAESHAHGVEVSEVHFHEVGMMDAIVDVAAVCMLMESVSPDKICASPVHVGSGHVKCAHGIMPVPAPAAAYILQGIPVYGGEIEGELCTPTGAALLKYFVEDFGAMPCIITDKIGYGMGSRDFPRVNCLRAMLGRLEETAGQTESGDMVIGLACNIDDMTGEEIGFAIERLYDSGAREVYTVPVGMKKSRPGILLEVLCAQDDKEKMLNTIFRHTTTIGIRETEYKRHILDRKEENIETGIGTVHFKRSEGYGIVREKYEYEDLARLAREKDMSLSEIRKKL